MRDWPPCLTVAGRGSGAAGAAARARPRASRPGAGDAGAAERHHRRRRRRGRPHDAGRRATRVRTGVTAILPHSGNLFREKVPGAVFVGNAFGKLAGSTQVEELGTIETPIVLTNTLSVGAALDAVVRWTRRAAGQRRTCARSTGSSARPTTAALNDIRGFHVTREHVRAAIAAREERRGRRRRGRRRHRHDRVRLEGRHRHVVAPRAPAATTSGRSACSCRRTTAGV